MKYIFATTASLAVAGTACAQEVTLKPIAEARLRYEQADQAGLATETSDALTIRARAGLSANSGAFSATLVGQGTLAAIDDYYDGLNGAATRPIIADRPAPSHAAAGSRGRPRRPGGAVVHDGREVRRVEREQREAEVAAQFEAREHERG